MNYKNKVIIEYLYLDLNVCDRCIGTYKVLRDVVKVMVPTLNLAGYKVILRKKEMSTSELAIQYQFLSSPTIRVNGKDICGDENYQTVEENDCSCCSDLVGTSIDCRIFRYGDKTYEVPPKEMLANSILKTLFFDKRHEAINDYIMPENLKLFYLNKKMKGDSITMKKMSIFEPALCCDTGICGVSVDPELLRISTVINALKKNGVAIDRFNLNNAPMSFINNKVINNFINEKGVDGLPAVMLDDEIIITGRYPSNDEIISYLDIPASYLTESKPAKKKSCCCSDDKCC